MTETNGWDDYWAGSRSGVAFGSEGIDHPLLTSFWHSQFDRLSDKKTILDVAAGRGALQEHLEAGALPARRVAIDFSEAALASLVEHHPGVLAVTADVTAMPFRPEAFDAIVSQFGVEYGGDAAVAGLSDYLAPKGHLLLIMHSEDSMIFDECRDNLSALEELEKSQFIPFAEAMFQAGYDVVRGSIGRKEAAGAARRLLEPFHGLAGIMDRYGQDVAGGTIQTLYRETARIQERFQYHLEEEVLQWLRTMRTEVNRYQARMRSMMQAACSRDDIDAHIRRWQEEGLTFDQVGQIHDENGRILGWAVSGVKGD